jgi:hypothetical protein
MEAKEAALFAKIKAVMTNSFILRCLSFWTDAIIDPLDTRADFYGNRSRQPAYRKNNSSLGVIRV